MTDLTGMPTPKQDERTPGRLAESLAQMIIEWVDGSKGGDWKTGLPNIIQRRIDRLDGNAYGSTDALRSALANLLKYFGGPQGVSMAELGRDAYVSLEMKVRIGDLIDAHAALSGSPAPSTPPMETEMTDAQIKHMVDRFLSWKLPTAFNPDGGISFERIAGASGPHPFVSEPVGTNLFSADQAAEMVRHMLEGLPSASPAPSTEGLREAPCDCSQEDVHDYGPCGESCRALAVTDEWRAFHSLVQPNVWGIECGDETIIPPSLSERTAKFVAGKYNDRTALAGVTAPAKEGTE